jgi:hypothetical protein
MKYFSFVFFSTVLLVGCGGNKTHSGISNTLKSSLYSLLEAMSGKKKEWRARRDSNSRPTAPEAAALSS